MKFKILKYYLVIFFLLFFIFIYGLELYLYSSSQDLETRLRKHYLKTHKNYDKRTKIEIFDQLKNNNVTIAISPRSNLDSKSILPLAGMPNIKTIHCKESSYYSIYPSDRYGFNNPDDQWDEQIIDYVIIGDSFTQGACVNRPHDISSVLRTFYNKSSLNLGYSGNGPLIEYATLKEYLRPNVKKILMIFYEGNDLQDLNNELNSKILNLYLNNPQFSQNLKSRQYEINKLLINTIKKEYENQLKIENNLKKQNKLNNKLLRFIKIQQSRFLIRKILNSKKLELHLDQFINILKMTKELSKKNNSEFYFVYLPEFNRYHYKYLYPQSTYNNIKKIINDLDIPFLDLHEELFNKEKQVANLFALNQNLHLNENGYKKVADKIYEFTYK